MRISKAVGRGGDRWLPVVVDDPCKGKRDKRSPGTLVQDGQRNGLRGVSSLSPLQASNHVTAHRAPRDTLAVLAVVAAVALALAPIVAGVWGML